MRYRVAFYGRVMSDGSDSGMQPSAELDLNIPEGVVVGKELVEKLETQAQHSQEVLDEDDAFLGSAATEVWEYDVVNKRCREFEDALENSDLVLEADIIDTTVTTAEEEPPISAAGETVYPADSEIPRQDDPQSGVRAGNDGPAGMPTGSKDAGGLNPQPKGEPELGTDSEDLNIVKPGDHRLGLTNHGTKPAEDWAANTGPGRNPNRRL